MPTCKKCGQECDELQTVKIGRRTVRMCEDCADEAREAEEIAAEAEGVMRGMMEYKGR